MPGLVPGIHALLHLG